MSVRTVLAHWRVALLAGLVLGVVFGLIEGFSIFALAFVDDLGIERGEASGMYSAYLLASTVSAPLAGRMVDRFGPRVVIPSTFPVFAVGILLCSQATALWHLYLIYIGLVATATTVLIVASQVMVSNAYTTDRGKALGIAYSCVGLGNFLLFNVLGTVVEHGGWRVAYLVAAGLAAAVGVLLIVIARALPGRVPAEPEQREARPGGRAGRSAFARPAFWFIACAALAASVLDFVIFQHLVPFLVTGGYDLSSAGFMLSLASLGYIAGQLGAGVLSDRYGREVVGIGAAVVFALSLVVVWPLPPAWAVGVTAVLLGLSIGGVIGCRSAAVGDLFAGPALGRVSGTIQVASALGAAFGTWLGGFGYDLTGSYDVTFVIVLVCALVWAAALWGAAPRRARAASSDTASSDAASSDTDEAAPAEAARVTPE